MEQHLSFIGSGAEGPARQGTAPLPLWRRLRARVWPWPSAARRTQALDEARRILEAWVALHAQGPGAERLWIFGWGDRRAMPAWTDGRGGARLLLWTDNAPYTPLPRWLALRVEEALTVDGRFVPPAGRVAIDPRPLPRSGHARLQAMALLAPPEAAFLPLPPETPDVCG